MALNIPSESPFMDSFNKGMETGSSVFQRLIQPYMDAQKMAQQYQQHLDELPSKTALRNAQIQEAMASAREKNFMFDMMGQDIQGTQPIGVAGMVGQGPYANMSEYIDPQQPTDLDITQMPTWLQEGLGGKRQPIQGEQEPQIMSPADLELAPIGTKAIIDEGNPRLYKYDKYAGLGKIPKLIEHTNPITGNTIITYPSGKRVETKLAPSQLEVAQGKSDIDTKASREREMDKMDIQWASDLVKASADTATALDTYNNLEKLFETPVWQKLKEGLIQKYGMNWMRHKDINYRGLLSNKEEGDIIGRIQSLSGDIIAKNSKLFSGPFRIAEQKLLESMKPQSTDPIHVQLGKLKEMKRVAYLQALVDDKVSKKILEEGIRGTQALREVKQELGIDQTLEQYRKEFLSPIEEQEKAQGFDPNSFIGLSNEEFQKKISDPNLTLSQLQAIGTVRSKK